MNRNGEGVATIAFVFMALLFVPTRAQYLYIGQLFAFNIAPDPSRRERTAGVTRFSSIW
jgi:hypothetical protein